MSGKLGTSRESILHVQISPKRDREREREGGERKGSDFMFGIGGEKKFHGEYIATRANVTLQAGRGRGWGLE